MGYNLDKTVLVSAARTATTLSADFVNNYGRGVMVFLNVTVAAVGTGGLQVVIQGKDPVSGNYYQLNSAPTAIVAVSQKLYILYPGSSNTGGSADQVCGGCLPRTWRIRVIHGDATSYTYSVGATILL